MVRRSSYSQAYRNFVWRIKRYLKSYPCVYIQGTAKIDYPCDPWYLSINISFFNFYFVINISFMDGMSRFTVPISWNLNRIYQKWASFSLLPNFSFKFQFTTQSGDCGLMGRGGLNYDPIHVLSVHRFLCLYIKQCTRNNAAQSGKPKLYVYICRFCSNLKERDNEILGKVVLRCISYYAVMNFTALTTPAPVSSFLSLLLKGIL